MTIGRRLKEERERLKLSQPAFGDIDGVGKNTVISWEKNASFPTAAFLEKAAKRGVDVSYVITGKSHDSSQSSECINLILSSDQCGMIEKALLGVDFQNFAQLIEVGVLVRIIQDAKGEIV